MAFTLLLAEEAAADLEELEKDRGLSKRLKAVRKTLGLLEMNPRHPGLQTHELLSLSQAWGQKVFEAYAEQGTLAAYRIFWHYGPAKGEITIVAITRHP